MSDFVWEQNHSPSSVEEIPLLSSGGFHRCRKYIHCDSFVARGKDDPAYFSGFYFIYHSLTHFLKHFY
jgi:hypothetical protein